MSTTQPFGQNIPDSWTMSWQPALTTISDGLAALMPPGATRIHYQAAYVINQTRSELTAYDHDNQPVPIQDTGWYLHDALRGLRKQMYRPDIGAWYTITFDITSNGQRDTDINWQSKPADPFYFDGVDYLLDLEEYPLPEPARPPWLTETINTTIQELRSAGWGTYPGWLRHKITDKKTPPWLADLTPTQIRRGLNPQNTQPI